MDMKVLELVCDPTDNKYTSPDGQAKLTHEDFDDIFGHREAITDFTCAPFACESADLYPGAKVIFNHRRDVTAWYNSFTSTLARDDGNPKDLLWSLSWFR